MEGLKADRQEENRYHDQTEESGGCLMTDDLGHVRKAGAVKLPCPSAMVGRI